MCGIFGAIAANSVEIDRNISPHRGPDDWGAVYRQVNDKHLTVFQSRLSIIGLGAQGHQPFAKVHSKILAYNGEIYNFRNLRFELETQHGIRFITNTDTEVLYEALDCWPLEKVLAKLNGIFAFAYYDETKGELLLARDQLGVKPLYYYHDQDQFLFASEAKLFFELALIKPRLNSALLGEYFANGWIYEPDTLFEGVFKLPAANYLRLKPGQDRKEIVRYWDFSAPSAKQPELEAVIAGQMIADVPIGLYFSGGVDSSLLAYYLKDQGLLHLNLWMDDSESQRLNSMERDFSLDVVRIQHDPENLDAYRRLIFALDEPVADAAIIPAYRLAEASRQAGRVVMLSGMGGDEIDAGYPRHRILAELQKLRLGMPLIKLGASIFKGRLGRDFTRLSNFLSNPEPQNYFSLTAYFSQDEISRLTGSAWFEPYSAKIEELTAGLSGNKRFFGLDMKGFLASHNLLYMDKASMAASVEVRVPFLDKDFVQAYFEDIDNPRLAGKKRLRSRLRRCLGHQYYDVKKQGFRYPVWEWITCKIDWREVFDDFEKRGIIDTSQPKEWLKATRLGSLDGEQKLWSIYTLYLWLQEFHVS